VELEVIMPSASRQIDPAGGFFQPHPNLGDEVNDNICRSDVEGGVFVPGLPVGAQLEVETKNHVYRIENLGNGLVRIAGHPEFCPEPVAVKLHGCTWGHSMLRLHYIGRGMFLEFRHPVHGVVRTSRIRELRELPDAAARRN
jgi:hypothetical protein